MKWKKTKPHLNANSIVKYIYNLIEFLITIDFLTGLYRDGIFFYASLVFDIAFRIWSTMGSNMVSYKEK